MLPLSTNQKRNARIDKLTHALHEMRPFRRRGDVTTLKRIDGELELLRASQRNQKRRA
jgi:hypothetical protein